MTYKTMLSRSVVAAVTLLAALLLFSGSALAEGSGENSCKKEPGKSCAKKKLKPLTRVEARRAARKALKAELGADASVDGLRCKRKGRLRAVCFAAGTLAAEDDAADEPTGDEPDAPMMGDDEADEESLTTWKARLVVCAYRDADGKRRVKAKLVNFEEFAPETDDEGDSGDSGDTPDGGGDAGAGEPGPDAGGDMGGEPA